LRKALEGPFHTSNRPQRDQLVVEVLSDDATSRHDFEQSLQQEFSYHWLMVSITYDGFRLTGWKQLKDAGKYQYRQNKLPTPIQFLLCLDKSAV